jgi:hypothetical protein
MDEVRSYVHLNLPFSYWQGRSLGCSTSSSNPILEGLGADSEEKHEPVSDTDTAVADSQSDVLCPGRPIREADFLALLSAHNRGTGDRITAIFMLVSSSAPQAPRAECPGRRQSDPEVAKLGGKQGNLRSGKCHSENLGDRVCHPKRISKRTSPNRQCLKI